MTDSTRHDLPPAAAIRAAHVFAERLNRPAALVAVAPGRVNLIGEHVDYCGGFVLPIAIDRYTAIAFATAPSRRTVRIGSGMIGQTLEFSLDTGRSAIGRLPAWARYVFGVIELMIEAGDEVAGFDAWIESDVPQGAGLSSSAALEVATAVGVDALHGRTRDPMDIARLCQRAEHEFAGVPCGIMDMATSAAATAGHAVMLDCRSEQIKHVPMDDPAVRVLIANTNVSHELADGAYARRRAQCEEAARVLGVELLRDATLASVDAARDKLDPVVYRRARHVVSEIERTVEASDLLGRRQWEAFGQKMYASHDSLRHDYEVSCDELDVMVDIARRIGIDGGVFGSRMTGGGFGGCTVWLVDADRLDAVATRLVAEYKRRTGIDPAVFATRPAAGAHVLMPQQIQARKPPS